VHDSAAKVQRKQSQVIDLTEVSTRFTIVNVHQRHRPVRRAVGSCWRTRWRIGGSDGDEASDVFLLSSWCASQ
jgi:hypothetical protein